MDSLVSVIIPTYQRADSLVKAIESVLNQTYKNLEIIVVDDNNPDSVFRKMTEHKMGIFSSSNKVKYIQHEYNKNGAAARNTGIKNALGEYIAFLDDDDEFLSTKIEKQVEILKRSDESVFGVRTGYSMCNNQRIIYHNYAKESGDLKLKLLKNKVTIAAGSTMLFKKEKVLEIGGFDETFQRHQDIELLVRLFNNYNLLTVSELLVVINADDNQNRLDGDSLMAVKSKFFETFKKEIDMLPSSDQREIYTSHLCEVAKIYLKHHNFKEFFAFSKKNKILLRSVLQVAQELYFKKVLRESK